MVGRSSGKSVIELKEHLQKNKIGFRHQYEAPLYQQPVLKKLGLDYSELHLPHVEKVAGQVIGLPNHSGLGQEELDRIVEVLEGF